MENEICEWVLLSCIIFWNVFKSLESSWIVCFFKLVVVDLNIIIFIINRDYERLILFWNVCVNLLVFKKLGIKINKFIYILKIKIEKVYLGIMLIFVIIFL